MLNTVWFLLLATGILAAGTSGNIDVVTAAALDAARGAVSLCLSLVGIMALWLGIMRIGEKAGLVEGLARLMAPLLARLFPSLPASSPALGAIVINLACNILGLGNAATPFGMKAMQEMQEQNPDKDTATEAMCTFLALNTSCLTLIPATVIGVRAASGSTNPAEIVGPTVFATLISMTVGIIVDYVFRRANARRKAR